MSATRDSRRETLTPEFRRIPTVIRPGDCSAWHGPDLRREGKKNIARIFAIPAAPEDRLAKKRRLLCGPRYAALVAEFLELTKVAQI